jgi:hypothetical protein
MLSLAMTVPYTLMGKGVSSDDIFTDRMFTASNSKYLPQGLSVYLIGPRGVVHGVEKEKLRN